MTNSKLSPKEQQLIQEQVDRTLDYLSDYYHRCIKHCDQLFFGDFIRTDDLSAEDFIFNLFDHFPDCHEIVQIEASKNEELMVFKPPKIVCDLLPSVGHQKIVSNSPEMEFDQWANIVIQGCKNQIFGT